MIDAIVKRSGTHHLAAIGPWTYDYDFDAGKTVGGAVFARDAWPKFPPFPLAILTGQKDRSDKIYVLTSNDYYRYDVSGGIKLDPDYPRAYGRNWPGLEKYRRQGLRTAVTLPDDTILFFTDSTVVRYDWTKGVQGNAEPIATALPGLPTRIDAATMGSGNRSHMLYVFKGANYWRFDTTKTRIDGANGSPVKGVWRGLKPPIPDRHMLRGRQLATSPLQDNWKRFTKAELLAGAYARLQSPDLIMQRRTPMCGQAALLYAMARWHPDSYRRAALDAIGLGGLPGSGIIRGKSHDFTPRDRLYDDGIMRGSDIAPIDWITMAILRDDENWLRGVGEDRGQVANGITTVAEMKGYARQLLPGGTVQTHRAFKMGKRGAIGKAQTAVDAGGIALLLTCGSTSGDPMVKGPFPNHWVVMLGGLKVHTKRSRYTRVDLRCWSWGEAHTVSMDRKTFRKAFYGAVTWRP